MKKYFCASCNLEKSSPNPFKLSGENPDFCKQCRATTASYWAEEPRPSVHLSKCEHGLPKRAVDVVYYKSDESKNMKKPGKSKSKKKPVKAETIKSPVKSENTMLQIKQAWKEEAQHRANVAKQTLKTTKTTKIEIDTANKEPKRRISMSMEIGDIAIIKKVSKIEKNKKTKSDTDP